MADPATDGQRRGLDRALHDLFEASILLKAVSAGFEFLSGLVLALTSHAAIISLIDRLTISEVTERPRDRVAAALCHLASHFSVDAQAFYAFYLLAHGAIKLALVAGLWARKEWSYPASIVALALFIVYQIHRYLIGHGVIMLALSAFDLLIIALIWREWRRKDTGSA